MTTRQVVYDDIDGTEGAETIRFGLRDQAYDIDLTAANLARLEKALQPFIDKAREAGRRNRSTEGDAATVREWCAANGIEVNAKGRIPAEIVEQYKVAQA